MKTTPKQQKQAQNQPSYSPPQRKSIVKIKFLPKHSHQQFIQSLLDSQSQQTTQLSKKPQNILQLQSQSEAINPWSTSNPIYSRQDQMKGMKKLIQNSMNKIKKRKRIDINNNCFINRAALTTRSWNTQRQRLMNLRKQMHMASPVFQPHVQTSQDNRNGLRMHDRQYQQSQPSEQDQQQTKLKKLFNKHRQLLSRIYSHSCQPSMIITNKLTPHQSSHLPSASSKTYTLNKTRHFNIVPQKSKGIKINKIFSMQSQKSSRQANSHDKNKQEEDVYNFRCTSFKRVFRSKEKQGERKSNQKYFSEEKYRHVRFEDEDESQFDSRDKNMNQIRIVKISSVGSNVTKKKQLVII